MKGNRCLAQFMAKVPVVSAALVVMVSVPPAQGAENGMGVYPLGHNSSMAGFLPPPGLYLRNDVYVYQGTADKIALSGRVEASIRGRYIMDLANLT